MQILKEEVRRAIIDAAWKAFRELGYQAASMRQIAQAAGITTGNIYRYFGSKEELFDVIVGPVYEKYSAYTEEYRGMIDAALARSATGNRDYFRMMESTFVALFNTFSAELMILLNRSQGTRYETVKPELIAFTEAILLGVFHRAKGGSGPPADDSRALAGMLAGTLVEGISRIVQEHEDAAMIELLIDKLLEVYSAGIAALIDDMGGEDRDDDWDH